MEEEPTADEELRDFGEFLDSLNIKVVWYRRWMPWLPHITWNKYLRLLTFVLWDNHYVDKSITKKHFIDILVPMHRKKWQPPICGIQFWL